LKPWKKPGWKTQVAKAISKAVRDSHDAANLATKADLREMELRGDAMMGIMLAAVISLLVKSFF